MSTLSSRNWATDSSVAGALRGRRASGAVSCCGGCGGSSRAHAPAVALQAREQVVQHFAHKHHVLVEAQAVDDEPVAAAQHHGAAVSLRRLGCRAALTAPLRCSRAHRSVVKQPRKYANATCAREGGVSNKHNAPACAQMWLRPAAARLRLAAVQHRGHAFRDVGLLQGVAVSARRA